MAAYMAVRSMYSYVGQTLINFNKQANTPFVNIRRAFICLGFSLQTRKKTFPNFLSKSYQ